MGWTALETHGLACGGEPAIAEEPVQGGAQPAARRAAHDIRSAATDGESGSRAMGGDSKGEGGRGKPDKDQDRQARLAQELRANLLKRKAQGRPRKAPPPPKEGRQR